MCKRLVQTPKHLHQMAGKPIFLIVPHPCLAQDPKCNFPTSSPACPPCPFPSCFVRFHVFDWCPTSHDHCAYDPFTFRLDRSVACMRRSAPALCITRCFPVLPFPFLAFLFHSRGIRTSSWTCPSLRTLCEDHCRL